MSCLSVEKSSLGGTDFSNRIRRRSSRVAVPSRLRAFHGGLAVVLQPLQVQSDRADLLSNRLRLGRRETVHRHLDQGELQGLEIPGDLPKPMIELLHSNQVPGHSPLRTSSEDRCAPRREGALSEINTA